MGLARHDEVELDCPFCGKGKVKTFHKEGFLQASKSSISGGSKTTFQRRPDTYMVADGCPNCKKTAKEIEQAFNKGVTKVIPHEKRIERMQKSGIPTAIMESKFEREEE